MLVRNEILFLRFINNYNYTCSKFMFVVQKNNGKKQSKAYL